MVDNGHPRFRVAVPFLNHTKYREVARAKPTNVPRAIVEASLIGRWRVVNDNSAQETPAITASGVQYPQH